MKNSFDRFLNRQNVEFSKNELEKLASLKIEYANKLYEEFTYDYEMFDYETSTHPISTSKINVLERIKQDIENGKIFDRSYFDILKLKGATVKFNDQKFIAFAVGYSILDHDSEQSAFIVLKEIWQVHLLNLMILEYHKNDIQLSTNYFKINMDFDSNIFPNAESHQFFVQTVNRKEFQIKRNWISPLYRILKYMDNGKNEVYLKSSEFEFAEYWNKHQLNYFIKSYQKGIGLDGSEKNPTQTKQIELWYKEFKNE